MKAINATSTKTLNALLALAENNGGHTKLTSPGWMALSIEKISDRMLSLAHYFEQNGDLMADPEMTFWHAPDGKWYPASYRLDSLGIFRESIILDYGTGLPTGIRRREQADEASFANTWFNNIRHQGFLKAA